MAENDFERTEAPTPRRQQEAREQGNIARSGDLTAALTLLAGVVLLQVFGVKLMTGFRASVEMMLRPSGNPARPDDVQSLLGYGAQTALYAAAPIILGIAVVALLVNLGQVGFIATTRPLEPDFSRLSPLRGLRHLFDARAGVRLIMSVAKVIIIIAVASVVVFQALPQILALAELPVIAMLGAAAQIVYDLALKLAALLLVLAIADYAYQRWQRYRDLRMTRQEVKEEMRRMEGDPLIKQRRSRVARQLALQRISSAVPKADVIVTNPTHFAVALQYDSKTMSAPKVIAKGADYLAMRIRQLAAIHEVPMVERKELARALYRTVEVGQEVPPQFYNAVAEILAYVYRLSGQRTA